MVGKRVRYDTAFLPLNLEEFKSNLENCNIPKDTKEIHTYNLKGFTKFKV